MRIRRGVQGIYSLFLPTWLLDVSRTTSYAFLVMTTPRRAFLPHPWSRYKFIDERPANSDGTCVRDYLHVVDLAKGHLLALNALSEDSKVFDSCPTPARFKAYNLGKGTGMSVLQIVEAMRKATGFDYKYEIIGRR